MKTKKNSQNSQTFQTSQTSQSTQAIREKTKKLNQDLIELIFADEKKVIIKEQKRLKNLSTGAEERYRIAADRILRSVNISLSQLLQEYSQLYTHQLSELAEEIKKMPQSTKKIQAQEIISFESELVKSSQLRPFFISGEEGFFFKIEEHFELLETLINFNASNKKELAVYLSDFLLLKQALQFLALHKIVKSFENYRFGRNAVAKNLLESGLKIYWEIVGLESLLLEISTHSKQQLEILSNWGLEPVSAGLLPIVQLYLMHPDYSTIKGELNDEFHLFLDEIYRANEANPRLSESNNKLFTDILVIKILQGRFLEAKNFYHQKLKALDVTGQGTSMFKRMTLFALQVDQYNNQKILFETLSAAIEGLEGYVTCPGIFKPN